MYIIYGRIVHGINQNIKNVLTILSFSFLISLHSIRANMTNEEATKIIEKVAIQKYDEDDEYALLSNDGPGSLIMSN